MSVARAATPGEPMPWDEYARREAPPLSEYIDGHLVMVPSPTREHQQVCLRLANSLESAIPIGYDVTISWAWKPGADEFIPDVMVHPVTNENVRFTGTPLLVVEVLSTNRSDDLVLKTGKYAAAGAPHYWIIDPRERTLDAYDLADRLYRPVTHVDESTPGPVPFGPASLMVDVKTLLR
jgi:Uma2 family endonuclease